MARKKPDPDLSLDGLPLDAPPKKAAPKKPAAPRVTRQVASIVPFLFDVALQVHPKTRGDSLADEEREKLVDATLHLAQTYPQFARILVQFTKVGALGEFGFVVGACALVHLAKAELVPVQYGQIAAMGLMLGWETVAAATMEQPADILASAFPSNGKAEDVAPAEAVG